MELQLFSVAQSTTKQQRTEIVSQVINSIREGIIEPLDVHVKVKAAEDLIKQLTSDEVYKNEVLDAASRYGGKSFEAFNAKFQVKETGVKYDYSNCNDSYLNDLQQQYDSIGEKIKERQKMLQTLPQEGILFTDQTSGDTYTIYPPAKSSTTSVAVTLK